MRVASVCEREDRRKREREREKKKSLRKISPYAKLNRYVNICQPTNFVFLCLNKNL